VEPRRGRERERLYFTLPPTLCVPLEVCHSKDQNHNYHLVLRAVHLSLTAVLLPLLPPYNKLLPFAVVCCDTVTKLSEVHRSETN
jgi:hypothetical protein